jgi:hypothetical protein
LIFGELIVLGVFFYGYFFPERFKIGFLWLNPIGAGAVVFFSLLLSKWMGQKNPRQVTGMEKSA